MKDPLILALRVRSRSFGIYMVLGPAGRVEITLFIADASWSLGNSSDHVPDPCGNGLHLTFDHGYKTEESCLGSRFCGKSAPRWAVFHS